MNQWLKSGGNENRHANAMTQGNILNVKIRFKAQRKEVMQYVLGEVKI